jgi:hypothetical protein
MTDNKQMARDLSPDEYKRRLAELSHPVPTSAPVPILPKHARDMTDTEYAAARRALIANH